MAGWGGRAGSDTLLPEVAKLTKESFDLDSAVSAAGELKYIGQVKRLLAAEFKEPSGEFLRLLAARIYPGRPFTQRIREEFSPLVAKATTQFLNEQARERLNTALEDNAKPVRDDARDPAQMPPLDPAVEDAPQGGIHSTDEELEGYRIVRAIVCSEVSASRVIGRDSKTYFAVILDNNSRKPIARLWFNRKQRYLGVFGSDKAETRLPIESPEGIYLYAAQLRATASGYLATDQSGPALQASPAPGAPARLPELAGT